MKPAANHFKTIETRHGSVDVYADCRVRIFDAFWATEPSIDGMNHDRWLLPQDFTNEQWETLNTAEMLASWRANCAVLQRTVETLRHRNTEKTVMLIAAGATILGLLGAMFGWA